jgi:hypothetical protein
VLLAVEFVEVLRGKFAEKKMKDSCKLDINQSVPENILSRPEVKRKQCGGDRYYTNIRA